MEKVFWFSKVSAVFSISRLKSGLRAVKPSLSPYVQNIYRIEVKYIFLEVVHQGISWEFFSDFSFFRYSTSPVENYWHWLLNIETGYRIQAHCKEAKEFHWFCVAFMKLKLLTSPSYMKMLKIHFPSILSLAIRRDRFPRPVPVPSWPSRPRISRSLMLRILM